MNKKYIPGIIIGTFTLALAGGFFLSSVFQPAENKDLITSTLVSDPSLSVAQPEDIELKLSARSSLVGAASHDLKITTNSPDGYTVSISTKTEETRLTSETTDDSIAAASSTVANPSALLENTWGFAVANSLNSAFDDSYSDGVPSAESKWSGITHDAVKFIDSDAPNYDGDPVKVYFAANVSKYVEAGTYSNIVVYSILPKTTSESSIPAPTIESVTPNFGPITGGEEITIVGTNYTKNGSSITTEVLIGGVACTDVVITADTPEVGKDTIVCKIPENTVGTKDVVVKTWSGEATATDAFTYETSDIIYVTPNIASTTAGAESGPAFTIYGGGFANESNPVVEVYIGNGHKCESFTVVSDTQITCTKGPNDGDTTTGTRRVFAKHQNGMVSGENVTVTYSDESYPVLNASTDLSTVCTTTKSIVRDARDSQLYYVQRMADGKCWMTDNLKYTGSAAGTLSQVTGEALSANKTTASTAGNYEIAKFVDPNTIEYCMGSTNMPGNTVTRCGLLYNWYSATAGTGNDTLTAAGAKATDSICPAQFRLPTSIIEGTTDYGDITTFETADYPILVASLNAGSLTQGVKASTSMYWYSGLQPSGAWSGIFSGYWSDKFVNVGRQGYFWSSSAAIKPDNKLRAHYLSLTSSQVQTGDASYANDTRNYGFAVRCVAE